MYLLSSGWSKVNLAPLFLTPPHVLNLMFPFINSNKWLVEPGVSKIYIGYIFKRTTHACDEYYILNTMQPLFVSSEILFHILTFFFSMFLHVCITMGAINMCSCPCWSFLYVSVQDILKLFCFIFLVLLSFILFSFVSVFGSLFLWLSRCCKWGINSYLINN